MTSSKALKILPLKVLHEYQLAMDLRLRDQATGRPKSVSPVTEKAITQEDRGGCDDCYDIYHRHSEQHCDHQRTLQTMMRLIACSLCCWGCLISKRTAILSRRGRSKDRYSVSESVFGEDSLEGTKL